MSSGRKVHIDFETGSLCDLKASGVAKYAEDPSTTAHCLAFAIGDGPCHVWEPYGFDAGSGAALGLLLTDHESTTYYSHNAQFELAIWNGVMVPKFGWPVLKVEQIRCTMAMGYAMGLPGKLEEAAPALGVVERKDLEGSRIMLKWCKPNKDGRLLVPSDNPAQFRRLLEYCKQDVEVERAMHKRMKELSPSEQALWVLDQKINQAGITVDSGAVRLGERLALSVGAELDDQMHQLTGGAVRSCNSVKALSKWLESQGVEVPSLGKDKVVDALREDDLPFNARRALLLRQDAAKASTAKLASMLAKACRDNRIRNCHQYHGAATGRWAGRGIQTQNMPRPRPGIKQADIEAIIEHLSDSQWVDMFYGPVLSALADTVRGFIIAPPGKALLACDLAAIEARVIAWLAGEERVLEVFRTTGKIYEQAASGIYNVPATDIGKSDTRRQIGKVAVLALGFGGGKGAFQAMAKNYDVKVSDSEAEQIKKAWRAANPNIVAFWKDVEEAAINAVRYPGDLFRCGVAKNITWKKQGSFLWCKLPSGRLLCYPYPRLESVETPWGEMRDALSYRTVVSNLKAKIIKDDDSFGKWQRIQTYGGSLSENLTQAVARDILAFGLTNLDARGAKIIMHVHDEVVLEVSERNATPQAIKAVEDIMCIVPDWAQGLPLAAEGWAGRRYRK